MKREIRDLRAFASLRFNRILPLVSGSSIPYAGRMLHTWRAASAGTLTVLSVVLMALLLRPPETAAAVGEIETRTVSTYAVTADGGVRVTITAQVTNRDPSTERRDSGRVLFYSAVAFAVHDAATNIVARSGSTRLRTETTGTARGSDDPFRLMAVRFDRELYFNESLPITLEYDLSAVRATQLLVNPQYAFVPAIGQGTYSLVRITAPADRQVTIRSANCARTSDNPTTYLCGASTASSEYGAGGRCAFSVDAPRWDCAFTKSDFVVIPFEATAANLAMASRSSRVTLAESTVQVDVSHFAGDEAWAARVEEIVRRGMPLLERANGYRYQGPRTIEVVESGYRDTHGYEGLANNQGRIRLTPVADDQTILHEISHLWSGIFASRWLAEGMADYTANTAARAMNIPVATVPQPLPPSPRLEDWGALGRQIAVSSAEREREESGYARSLRFVELLSERAGAETLQTVNATLAQEGSRAGARRYLDAIEDATGGSYAPLFAEWAFTGADIQLLPARAKTRDAAAALNERATRIGLDSPADLTEALRAWDFDRAQRLIASADEAITLHVDTTSRADESSLRLSDRFAETFARSADEAAPVARAEANALDAVGAVGRLEDDRSLVMRVGLLGRNLSADAAAARDAFARGEFETAIEQSDALQGRLDTAARDGIIRIAVAVCGLLLLLGVLVARGRSLGRRAGDGAPRRIARRF